jgi:hypothetical protein
MNKLENMIHIACWILVIGCPIIIGLKTYYQVKYESSLEKIMANHKGYELNYMKGTLTLLILFLISLIYLIS